MSRTNMHARNIQPLACPFCGVKAHLSFGIYGGKSTSTSTWYFVECGGCGCRGPIYLRGEACSYRDSAILAWNSRAAQSLEPDEGK